MQSKKAQTKVVKEIPELLDDIIEVSKKAKKDVQKLATEPKTPVAQLLREIDPQAFIADLSRKEKTKLQNYIPELMQNIQGYLETRDKIRLMRLKIFIGDKLPQLEFKWGDEKPGSEKKQVFEICLENNTYLTEDEEFDLPQEIHQLLLSILS